MSQNNWGRHGSPDHAAQVNDLMDEDQLKQWILRRFGAPFLKVEISADQLQDAINDAKRWFSAKKGVKKQAVMQVLTSKNAYLLPDIVDTVIDVAFPVAPLDFSLVFSPFMLIDEKVPYDTFAAPGQIGLYSSLTQTLQYIETAKRILGADPDWRQEDRFLYIFPVPQNSGGMIIFFKSNKFTIEQLNERDFNLIQRYALARAKLDIGRIRSKYDGYPTASGSVQLDGDKLLAEAEKELMALDEEISLSGFPMGYFSA